MSGYKVHFHKDTTADYDEAYAWYEDQQTHLGDKFQTAVRATITEIIQFPEAFGQKHKHGYREATVDGFPFSIVYQLFKRTKIIFITSIHHHKKHPRKKYRDRI
ncbi:MAG: type II toxin-antitoxin system RelE/ParE family toxin [Bacteroidota bacterium]